MEENFENKKSKSFLKVLIPIILILAIVAVALFFISKNREKPVSVFKRNVEKVFAKVESKDDAKTVRTSIGLTATVDSDNVNIKALKQYVESAKITYNQEVDLNKKLIKYNAKVDFNNEQIIDADMILKNGKFYVFAKEFFSKYIEINPADFEMEDYNEMLDEMFKIANKVSAKETNKLMKDIEKAVIEFLEAQEYSKEKEEITVGGKSFKATKSTLELNEKQMAELLSKVLNVVKESEYALSLVPSVADMDLKAELEKAIESLKNVKAGDFKLQISIYTHGVAGEVARIQAAVKQSGSTMFTLTFDKESKENSVLALNVQGMTVKVEINKKDKNTTEYKLVLPKMIEGVELKVEHVKEEAKKDKYKGKVIITAKLPGMLLAEFGITDDVEAKLNITYDTEANVNVEDVDVSNAVSVNEFTREHEQEVMENFQKSKLYSLVESFM